MKFIYRFNAILFLSIALISNVLIAQKLNPADGIEITFSNIEDSVKGNFYIQDDGQIHIPYLGKINTVDKDFSEIESEIIAGYETLYTNPEIVVRPLLQINILGEVRNPGVYYLSGFETLSELFEIAGGETSDANINKIILVRNDNILDLDLSSFLYGGNNLNDIGITSGDKIYIPKNWWVEVRDASILVSGVTVLVALASIITN